MTGLSNNTNMSNKNDDHADSSDESSEEPFETPQDSDVSDRQDIVLSGDPLPAAKHFDIFQTGTCPDMLLAFAIAKEVKQLRK